MNYHRCNINLTNSRGIDMFAVKGVMLT